MNQIIKNNEEKNLTRKTIESKVNLFRSAGLERKKELAFIQLAELDFKNRIYDSKASKETNLAILGEYIELATLLVRLDFMPDLINHKAYIIPYYDKDKKRNSLRLQIGFKGYLDLASDSGWSLNPRVVYKDDTFDINLATNEINHNPSLTGRVDKNIIGVYCVATRGQERVVDFMSREEIDKIMAIAPTKYIWDKWYGEMAKKSIIKRICKILSINGTKLELADNIDSAVGYQDIKNPVVVNDTVGILKSVDNQDRDAFDDIIEVENDN